MASLAVSTSADPASVTHSSFPPPHSCPLTSRWSGAIAAVPGVHHGTLAAGRAALAHPGKLDTLSPDLQIELLTPSPEPLLTSTMPTPTSLRGRHQNAYSPRSTAILKVRRSSGRAFAPKVRRRRPPRPQGPSQRAGRVHLGTAVPWSQRRPLEPCAPRRRRPPRRWTRRARPRRRFVRWLARSPTTPGDTTPTTHRVTRMRSRTPMAKCRRTPSL